MTVSIGFTGLGLVDERTVRILIRQGHTARVCNRTAAKAGRSVAESGGLP